MSKPAPDILRDLAGLAERRGLDGPAFAAAVDATAGRHRRDAPAAVRELAALVRWRGRNLSPHGVAAVLRGKAAKLAAGEGGGRG